MFGCGPVEDGTHQVRRELLKALHGPERQLPQRVQLPWVGVPVEQREVCAQGVLDRSVVGKLRTTHAAFMGTQSATPVVGSSTSGPLPLRTAMVCSLRSDVPGRSGRGRNYIPVSCGGMGTDGRFTLTAVDDIGADWLAAIQAINGLNLSADSVTSQKIVVASFTT